MAQGYYGTANDPLASLHSERKVITPQTSGGSLEEGRYRLRTDLNSGDRIATYEINVGNGVEEVPVFPLSADADAEIQKYRQTYIPGEGWGFVPLLASGAAYPQLQFYHGGDATWYKWHDSLSTIPDSAVLHYPLDAGSGTTYTEELKGEDGSAVGSPTWLSDTAWWGDNAISTDGTDDGAKLSNTTWLSQFQSGSFGIAFTIEASGVGDGPFWGGVSDSNFDNFVFIRSGSTGSAGNINFSWREGNNTSIRVHTDSTYDDGNEHRVFIDVSGNTASDIAIYVDDTDVAQTTASDGTNSWSNVGVGGAVMSFGARNVGGSLQDFIASSFDNTILYDSPSSADISQDYDMQPWS